MADDIVKYRIEYSLAPIGKPGRLTTVDINRIVNANAPPVRSVLASPVALRSNRWQRLRRWGHPGQRQRIEARMMGNPPQEHYKTTGDMLAIAEAIHRRLKRHYAMVAGSSNEADVAMLLNYINQKEARFQSMLSDYRRQAPAEVLDTYFQFTQSEYQSLEKLTSWQPDDGAGVSELLATAIKIDSTLQAFYRRAAQMAQIPSVREMFSTLADAMAEKKRDVALNAALIRDV